MMFYRWAMVLRNAEGGGAAGGSGGGGSSSSAGGSSGGGSSGGGSSGGGTAPTAGGSSGGAAAFTLGATGAGAGADPAKGAAPEHGSGDGKDKAPPSPKYKVKRDGQEREYSAEELAQLASDDYEEELTIDKAKIKRKRADLLRDAQLGGAAFQRMQEAAGVRRTYGDKIERLSTDLRGFIEDHLPADKPNALFELAKTIMGDAYQLDVLKKKDPDAYIAKIRERESARAKAQEEATRVAGERKQRQEQAQKRAKERMEAMPAAFEKLGMKPSAIKALMIDRIFSAADAQGYELTPEHAATFARDSLRAELAGAIGGLDGEALLEWLGPDVVKKIRGAEVKRLERGTSDESSSEPKPEPKPKKKDKEPRSLEDFANPNRWLG